MIKCSLLFVGILSASQVFAGGPPTRQDYFDCYQGFAAFPIQTSETGFNEPFFIVPIPNGEEHKGKDTFMILNPNGAQEVLTDAHPFHGDSKRELLSISPVGETTEVGTQFHMYEDFKKPDSFDWMGREDDPEYLKSPVSKEVKAQKIEVRALFSDEEETFLKFGVIHKLAENQALLKKEILKGYLSEDLKNHTPIEEAGLKEAAKKLEACNKFPNDIDLQTAKMEQYRVIAEEQTLIDRLNAKPAIGQSNVEKPAKSSASSPQ
jgi:hypothetical protein